MTDVYAWLPSASHRHLFDESLTTARCGQVFTGDGGGPYCIACLIAPAPRSTDPDDFERAQQRRS